MNHICDWNQYKPKEWSIHNLFFNYYQHSDGRFTYLKRQNKLDKLFDFICDPLTWNQKLFIRKATKWLQTKI